jgi:amino acid transporter
MNQVKPKRVLSVFMLTMINVATIGSIKNWPVTAEYGFASVFYFLFATLIFFIPVSLVAAELATGWPKTGGVFAWVKEAFGHRTGFWPLGSCGYKTSSGTQPPSPLSPLQSPTFLSRNSQQIIGTRFSPLSPSSGSSLWSISAACAPPDGFRASG